MTPWLPLETERLRLREFRAGDEADIHAFASDVEVVRFAHWGPNDFATTQAYLAGRLEEQQWPRDSVDMAVELRRDRRLIGTMRLTILNGHNRTADFGFTFGRPYWNQGYATEGARALLQVGMRREALFQKDVFQKGEWRDSYLYAILAEEWQVAGPS
jgi:[ribosomal protein S5]-alanine N-acetyltransferase